MLAGTIPFLPQVPCGIVILALLVAGWVLLRNTRFLTAIYAIGNNERAARANGISVARAKVGAYALAGTCAGAAACTSQRLTRRATPRAARRSR